MTLIILHGRCSRVHLWLGWTPLHGQESPVQFIHLFIPRDPPGGLHCIQQMSAKGEDRGVTDRRQGKREEENV